MGFDFWQHLCIGWNFSFIRWISVKYLQHQPEGEVHGFPTNKRADVLVNLNPTSWPKVFPCSTQPNMHQDFLSHLRMRNLQFSPSFFFPSRYCSWFVSSSFVLQPSWGLSSTIMFYIGCTKKARASWRLHPLFCTLCCWLFGPLTCTTTDTSCKALASSLHWATCANALSLLVSTLLPLTREVQAQKLKPLKSRVPCTMQPPNPSKLCTGIFSHKPVTNFEF